jgi:hypothetical protein
MEGGVSRKELLGGGSIWLVFRLGPPGILLEIVVCLILMVTTESYYRMGN